MMGTLATGQADVPVVLQVAVADGCVGRGLPVDADTRRQPRALLTPGTAPATHHRGDRQQLVLGARGVRARSVSPPPTDESHYRVALIGGNAKGQWATDVTTPDGQRKIAGYVRAIEQTTADLVVLPEGAFAATDNSLPTLVAPLTQMAAEKHATIVVGVVLNKHQNSAVAITDAHPPVVYDKWHDRGPRRSSQVTTSATCRTRTWEWSCAATSTSRTRSATTRTDGADLVALPASDEDVNGWQHSQDRATARSRERRRSGVGSPARHGAAPRTRWGRTVASVRTDASTVTRTADAAQPAPGQTVYNRLGHWFAWLCLVVTALGIAVTNRWKATDPQPLPRNPFPWVIDA